MKSKSSKDKDRADSRTAETILAEALEKLDEYKQNIQQTKDGVTEGKQRLKEIAKDLTTPPEEVRDEVSAINARISSADFEIEMIENRIMALVKVFPNLIADTHSEYRDQLFDYRAGLNDKVDKIIKAPTFLKSIEQLKVALYLAENPRHVLIDLGLQDTEETSYRDEAEKAGYEYSPPREPYEVSVAKEIHRKSKEPNVIYQSGGVDSKWYEA